MYEMSRKISKNTHIDKNMPSHSKTVALEETINTKQDYNHHQLHLANLVYCTDLHDFAATHPNGWRESH